LFQVGRNEYAFYIVLPLFWVFGFWGVVGTLLAFASEGFDVRSEALASSRYLARDMVGAAIAAGKDGCLNNCSELLTSFLWVGLQPDIGA
jgi:hypothetical protein